MSEAPQQEQQEQGLNITLDDLVDLVFRHKWKIIFFSIIGMAAAVTVYMEKEPIYRSQAKLMVRYVLEQRQVNPMGSGQNVRAPDGRTSNIIASEVEVLRSADLAKEVADAVGPERILGEGAAEGGLASAVRVLTSHFRVDAGGNSNVIKLAFDHRDPEVAKAVVEKWVEAYLRKHTKIHRSEENFEFLQRQTDQLGAEIRQLERELQDLKEEADAVDLERAQEAVDSQLAALNQSLLMAKIELAEETSKLEATGGRTEEDANIDSSRSGSVGDRADWSAPAQQLQRLRQKRAALLDRFTSGSRIVRRITEQIEEVQKELPEGYAATGAGAPATPNAWGETDEDGAYEGLDPRGRVAGLIAKTNTLHSEIQRLHDRSAELAAVKRRVERLERERELDEANYQYFSKSLEQARIDEALASLGRISNIQIVEEPILAGTTTANLRKVVAGLGLGGVAFGLGLAVLLEFFVNPTVKRPKDLRKQGRFALYLWIPELKLRAARRRLATGRRRNGGSGTTTLPAKPDPDNDPFHAFKPYYEGLRDRIIIETSRSPSTPKLIGVTSPTRKAGVTTIASGIAQTLAESGDGDVLLIDLNDGSGSAHPFLRRDRDENLPDIFEHEGLAFAVSPNLFVAKAVSENGDPHPVRTKKFGNELVPKLSASQYDFVIFDMPPADQTSVLGWLSRYLNLVVLVVRAETTTPARANTIADMASGNGTTVAAVLNRTRRYIPRWLSAADDG